MSCVVGYDSSPYGGYGANQGGAMYGESPYGAYNNSQMPMQSPFMPDNQTSSFAPNNSNNTNSNNPMMSSSSTAPPPQFLTPAMDIMNNPLMADVAKQFGSNLAKSGTTWLDKFLDTTNLKNYFAVDTNYVLNKLKILTVPFLHSVSHQSVGFVFEEGL